MTQGTEEGGGEKLPPALATVEVDIEQVVGVELNFYPGAAIGNDPETVKGFTVEMDG